MTAQLLQTSIIGHLGFSPSKDQKTIIESLPSFLFGSESKANSPSPEILLINGYAGTGKTSLIQSLIKALTQDDMVFKNVVLLSPTGIATKILSQGTGLFGKTIHKEIYAIKGDSLGFKFEIAHNKNKDTLFIIDESSMISSQTSFGGSQFGSGRILDDLITYIFSSVNNKAIFLGDKAQLPPIGEDKSYALDLEYMSNYKPSQYFELTTVFRQEKESGILHNATLIRKLIAKDSSLSLKLKLKEFSDFRRIDNVDLLETISENYSKYGIEQTLIITRSNNMAERYNQAIRASILDKEEELSRGDYLLICKNNYFYARKDLGETFIANGSIAIVNSLQRGKNFETAYGFHYANATLSFLDSPDVEVDCKLILDGLINKSPSMTKEQNESLFKTISEDYQGMTKRDMYQKLKQNPYLQALQIKYGYALTCHKAQGSGRDSLFIDFGYMPELEITIDLLRWLYTAITRARRDVYLVNFPQELF